jgi:hypothetical protein
MKSIGWKGWGWWASFGLAAFGILLFNARPVAAGTAPWVYTLCYRGERAVIDYDTAGFRSAANFHIKETDRWTGWISAPGCVPQVCRESIWSPANNGSQTYDGAVAWDDTRNGSPHLITVVCRR